MDLPNSRCSRFVSCRCKRNLVHRIFGQLFLRIRPATPLQVTLAASSEKASVVLRFRERADVLHGPKLGAGPPFHHLTLIPGLPHPSRGSKGGSGLAVTAQAWPRDLLFQRAQTSRTVLWRGSSAFHHRELLSAMRPAREFPKP